MAKKGAGINNRNANVRCSFGNVPGGLHIGAPCGGHCIIEVPLTIKVRIIWDYRIFFSPLKGVRVKDFRQRF